MTITNRELLYQDPTQTKIPNDGVAQVVRPETEQQWDVLRWELHSFVCDGQYARGLEKVLDSFLTNLTQAQQPAVWVSGFYGSGKSHMVRVLEHLWRDVALPTGERARDIVTLTADIRGHLTELSTAGKRLGGLWSAAGTLASGKSDAVRLAFLSILFESAGLPTQYEHARFTIWARENGYLDAIQAAVETEGRAFNKEIHDLYVSPVIAKALLDADPTLGGSVKDVRELLKAQFPPTTKDVTDDEMFDVLDDVLRLQSSTPGKLPLTLVVLDEMQQYIGDDNDKALAVQNIVQGCSARFESTVLFVATGQSALTATPTLQKLIDRFPLPVELSDNDVETVVREVVLRKKPEYVPQLKTTIDASTGEIDRHLGGTRFAPRAEEKPKLVPDYPVLPNRWRLWSEMLRAVDRAGKSGLVRSQLGLIHGGARSVADRPVGNVIGADYLFFDDKAHVDMLMSGVLLREVDDFIQRMVSEGGDSAVKGRLCALIFLISQMSQPVLGGETGLRATVPFLADLLVEDLAEDGARLRKRVPDLLEELVAEGRIVQDGDTYRLLTQEDAEWEKDYRTRLAAVRDDDTHISQVRSERLMAAVEAALGNLKLTHGVSKTPRKLDIHWGQDEPVVDGSGVPVWVRDEWSTSESAVRKAAAESGDESPIVFVFLPRHESDRIRDALATRVAAEETLNRPVPQTDEGRAARQAMASRRDRAEEEVVALFDDVVACADVFQGGGTELTTTSSLRDSVATAANRSLIRLFPKFTQGDNPNWGKVIVKAREGAPDALTAVGHPAEPTTHPVCKEVLAAISPGGTKGADLQKRFTGPRFGWPKDAVSGAVLVLLAAGNIRAAQDGRELGGPKELPQTQIGKVTLYKEDEPPSAQQRLALRGLLTAAGISYESGQEGAQIPALLQQLKDLAARTGGAPPLPEAPDTKHLDAWLALTGNQRFRKIADEHERISADLELWQTGATRREKREMAWRDLERLLRHADGLPVAETVTPAVAAIRDGRQLLDDPDPSAPLLSQLAAALRAEVNERAQRLADAQHTAVAELEAMPEWNELDPADRDTIVAEAKLISTAPPDVSTESKLLESLDSVPLSAWIDRITLVESRRDQARQRAAKKLEPKSVEVKPPATTFRPGDDPTPYFNELRAVVQSHLEAGTTVII
ncbi:BREX system P-loop protein BrxC [Rhodococcus ruber]|uniref:Putative P-loop containing nucleoside triphosphate hydrolase n=1 Tax=Rhodococcus ruber TaxID=1830 RepID=A0A098BUY3_9NOCA|nr:BREX system P-loop protein BrxC [Rhodococcus ruber]MDI9970273.1 BREX system P-loop protein BrxC [Rhodococcus ruber]MDI9985285.1 BREX system P-loop protein BrxC [Rhodococcus ruber]MDI9990425.1 BREX system P-loop protein BrxC [Rhodococcus ruber]MDI9995388.1 BREX system P-loop protein BrxC [Rhodococcus ruber]MDI9999997.1 BREX system P-loop protein BrxC [Rhodococcus ruber]